VFGRRQFLRGIGLATVAVATRSALSALPAAAASKAVASGGRLYRFEGTCVFVSTDAGSTWQLHTDFTSVYSVRGLSADRGGTLRATLRYQGRSFGLALASDQQAWLTV
jgi:hypothetical protein